MEEIVSYTRRAYERGFVGGTGGNVSFRKGEWFYITESGIALGDVEETSFVPVLLESGEAAPGNERKPSKEVGLHRAVYRERPDINVIFHLHPVDCIAAILMLDENELLPCYVPGHLKKLGRPPQVAYYPAGTAELAEHTAAKFRSSDCVWMRRHGIILGAKNCKTAFARAEDMIDSCRLHLRLQGAGALTQEEINQIMVQRGERR